MKKFGLLIILLTSPLLFSQTLLLEENFNFSGELTSNGWTAHSGATTNPINTTTGLSYTGYPSSAIGNAALLDNTGEDVNKTFTSVNSGNLYVSFLISVTSSHSTITEGYVLHLIQSTNFYSRFYVDYDNVSGNIAFGLGQTTGITAALKTPFNYVRGTTYLVIIKYSFISGLLNDEVEMWIFGTGVPSSETNAGAPTLGPTSATSESSTQDDPLSINSIALRQYNTNQNVIIDGIRISDSWSQAPLPVELTSFSTTTIGSSVKLSWNTATEVNNYGFEIHRQAHTSTPLSVTSWEMIGFVNGNGNSNSPKSYFYEDKNVTEGKYSYRLKQIDNDGQFEYSKSIEVDLGAPKKFELSQNYPNPFNPITTIRFNLPEAGNVKLTLFNILGQEIKTLVNEFKESGVHTINFDASDLNSGMYIYKLESGSFVQTRKMTLVK